MAWGRSIPPSKEWRGNSHTLTITNPPAGDNYITLYANQSFSGVTVSTQY